MALDGRTVGKVIAGGRVLYGFSCMAAPKVFGGPAAARAEGQMRWLVRAFGVRDVVLGVGTLMAFEQNDDAAQLWVDISTAADGLDIVNALAFNKELGRDGVLATLALAVPATAGGWWSGQQLRDRS